MTYFETRTIVEYMVHSCPISLHQLMFLSNFKLTSFNRIDYLFSFISCSQKFMGSLVSVVFRELELRCTIFKPPFKHFVVCKNFQGVRKQRPGNNSKICAFMTNIFVDFCVVGNRVWRLMFWHPCKQI